MEIIKKSIRSIQKADTSFLESNFVSIFATLFFSAVDFMTLYQMFDGAFYDAPYISVMVCLSAALILNGAGLLAALFLRRAEQTGSRVDQVMMAASVVIFALTYGSLFFVRFAMRTQTFTANAAVTTSSDLQLSSIDPNSAAGWAFTTFLALSPMLTSGLCFALGLFASDPKRRLRKKIELELPEMRKRRRMVESRIRALRIRSFEDDLSQEQKKFEALCCAIDSKGDAMKDRVRHILMETVGKTPEQVTTITEDMKEHTAESRL